MARVYQTCRICGVHVPSGFTNCDGCYNNADKAKAEAIKRDQVFKARFRPWKAETPIYS